MTESTQTPAIARRVPEPIDDLDGGLAVSPTDLGERLWHFFISMRTGLVLILALAVLGLIGTMLVQAPAGIQSDPQAYAVWLDGLRPKYGGWTNVFDNLGLFSVFNSVWFRGITVLLMTSVLACSVNRAPHLWKLTVHPRIRMTESFFGHAPLNAAAVTAAAPDRATAVVESAFRSRRFRTIVERDAEGGAVYLYADHNRWGPFGTVIAHLSLVVILVGALVGATFGFREDGVAVPVGSTVDIGYGTGLSVEATRFADSYYTNGSPSDYASDLVVYKDGQQVGAATIRVNQPLRVGDVALYQSFFGAAAAIHIADKDGNVVFDQGVPLQWPDKDGTHVVGQFTLPDAGLTGYLVAPASGQVDPNIKAGQIQVELYTTGSESAPVASTVLTQGVASTLDDLDVTFVRERQFTGLIVAKDPGAPFIWLGCFFLIAGTALVFFFPSRRAWALIRGDRDGSTTVHVAAVVRHDVGFQAEFARLSDEIETSLGATTDR
jgi:cytochrome c biogenesis protein